MLLVTSAIVQGAWTTNLRNAVLYCAEQEWCLEGATVLSVVVILSHRLSSVVALVISWWEVKTALTFRMRFSLPLPCKTFRVQHYRLNFRSYRFHQQQQQQHGQLNSCGNSECSDEDEVEVRIRGVNLMQFSTISSSHPFPTLPALPPSLYYLRMPAQLQCSRCTTAAAVK